MRRIDIATVAGLLALMWITSCTPHPAPPPVNPTAIDGGGDACDALCAHRRALHCHTAEPTMQGYSCEVVCENANDPGGPVAFDMACRLRATTCDAEARCQ